MNNLIINPNIKFLNRKRELIGAQGVFVHAVIWQPFVMLFTTHTAIAQFGLEYGIYAQVFAVSVIIALLLLYVDFWGSIADLYRGKQYTTTWLFRKLDSVRPYLLYLCSVWSLMLMSTVKAEKGFPAIFAYGLFFIGLSMVGVFMSLRDGCVDNKLQKDGVCING